MYLKYLSVTIYLLLLIGISTAGAQSVSQDLSSAIPIDTTIRTGTLDNGLTYYIRRNQQPENRVELRLAVNAGSILENDDQLGLAHFTEHMAFNGTEHYAKNELVSTLQSAGVRFGAHLNAYTSFDEDRLHADAAHCRHHAGRRTTNSARLGAGHQPLKMKRSTKNGA